MSKSIPKGTVNPVMFDQLLHNEHIEYHNGVVFIMQPGYYTFTVQARNGVKGRELALYILIEGRRVALGKRLVLNLKFFTECRFFVKKILMIPLSFDLYTATTTYTGYCNMYDMVQIEKAVDATKGGILTDWFEGRMIP